jgi:hypothetical protein
MRIAMRQPLLPGLAAVAITRATVELYDCVFVPRHHMMSFAFAGEYTGRSPWLSLQLQRMHIVVPQQSL